MIKNLKLERPIAFIDIETTGTHPHSDRIVELSIFKIQTDGSEDYRSHRVNPGVPIPAETTAVHGITDADVAEEPLFGQYAKGICEFLDGCDIAGFNVITFDLPFLEIELERAGDRFLQRKSRKLKDAYLEYIGKELEDAHGAERDATASAEVLDVMVEKYDDLPSDISGLYTFCNEVRKDYVDLEGKLTWADGEVIFNFGKHTGRLLKEIANEYPDYLLWILASDFRPDVYEIVKKALDGEFFEME